MRFKLAIIAVFVLLATPVTAQTINGYRLNTYPRGAATTATPTMSFDFLVTAITCNLVPPAVVPVGVAVNPSRATWDDPNVVGRICQWTDDGKGPLFAVPLGAYDAGLQAFNEAGLGPESTRVPFTRLAPPGTAPTGLRLIRPTSGVQ